LWRSEKRGREGAIVLLLVLASDRRAAASEDEGRGRAGGRKSGFYEGIAQLTERERIRGCKA